MMRTRSAKYVIDPGPEDDRAPVAVKWPSASETGDARYVVLSFVGEDHSMDPLLCLVNARNESCGYMAFFHADSMFTSMNIGKG